MRRKTLAWLALLASFACFAAVAFGLSVAVGKAVMFGVQTPTEFLAALHPALWAVIFVALAAGLYLFCMAVIIAYRWPPDP
jgi:hypothetical protein